MTGRRLYTWIKSVEAAPYQPVSRTDAEMGLTPSTVTIFTTSSSQKFVDSSVTDKDSKE